MQVQLVSDLHLETLKNSSLLDTGISPAPNADVLIIAGDIGFGIQAIAAFKDWPVPVLYVAGNHEYYRGDIEQVTAQLRADSVGSVVHFMERNCVVIGGVRFLGTTLWTDYSVYGVAHRARAMEQAEYDLNDHKLIQYGGRRFSARDAAKRCAESVAWLAEQLAQPFGGDTVVITHHGPHWNSVHAKYREERSLLSAAFVSDLTPLLGGPALWVHGHVHDSFDYTVNGTRVVTNPRGYPYKGGFENGNFDGQLVLRVANVDT